MGIFKRYTEDDAVRQIELINSEMRSIRLAIKRYDDRLCAANKSEVERHMFTIMNHARKYDRIKREFQAWEIGMLNGRTVPVWNGETTVVAMWELYFKQTTLYIADRQKEI